MITKAIWADKTDKADKKWSGFWQISIKPWCNNSLQTQSNLRATVDSQCLEYLECIPLTRSMWRALQIPTNVIDYSIAKAITTLESSQWYGDRKYLKSSQSIITLAFMYVNMYRRVAKGRPGPTVCATPILIFFKFQKSGVLQNVLLFAFLPWIPTKLSLGEGPPQLIIRSVIKNSTRFILHF